jgi:hypothetical protein
MKNDELNREVCPNWNTTPNPNQKLSTKLDDNPHKLALKYIINMINTQLDGDTETLDFLNLEITQA